MLIDSIQEISSYINSFIPFDFNESEWINIIGLEIAMISLLCAILYMEMTVLKSKHKEDPLGYLPCEYMYKD